MANRRVLWSKTAIKQFEKAIKFIASDSIVNAENVSNDILNELTKILKHPEFFPPDKYKKNNDGSYRAFEKHHYRIAYRVKDDLILIFRMRHTSREPKEY